MKLFKSLLLTLLVVGMLNSCTKDEETGNNDTSNNKDSFANSGYSTAVINSTLDEYSYTLTRASSKIEEFDILLIDDDNLYGEITFNNDGNPSVFTSTDGTYFDTIQIKYVGGVISEIVDFQNLSDSEYESNWKLIESTRNQYVYGIQTNYPDEKEGVEDGVKIDIYPDFDSIHIIEFDSYNGVVKEYDAYGFKYVKAVKVPYSLNYFNHLLSRYINRDNYLPFHIANILDVLGATYFFGASDKEVDIVFNDSNLPVRVDGGGMRRIWTATYQ